MKIAPGLRPLCLLLIVAAGRLAAQPADAPENRFNLSYRAGFNIKADFKNLGQPGLPGGPSVTGLSYEDGFVRPNSEPNDLGLSWNWGYQNASQVVGDNIVMTSSQRGSLGKDKDDSPVSGIELSYHRRLGWWKKSAWGIEGAVNYAGLEIGNKATPAAAVLAAHAFGLGGSVPPAAPYAGTPEGPGILIDEVPTTAALTVDSTLETTLFGVRVGPYLEYPFNDKWSVTLGGGLALAWVDSDFSFREIAVVDGTPATLRTGSNCSSELLPGFYVGADLAYKFCRSGSVFVGAQFQSVGDQTVKAGDKQVKLDLSQSIFLSVGVGFSF